MRCLIASVVMAIIFKSQKTAKRKLTKTQALQTISLSTIGIALYNDLLNMSEQTLDSSVVGFVAGQIPLVSTILATLFLNEKRSFKGWCGIMISFVGLAIIMLYNKHSSSHHTQGLIAMIIAIFLASAYVSLQKPLVQKISPITFTCYAIWGACASLLYFLPELILQLQSAPIPVIETLIYLGIFPSAIAYYTWSIGISKMDAATGANLLYFAPISTIVISWIVLHEEITATTLFGGLLTIAGALINSKYGKKH